MRRTSNPSRGFTLLELMISAAVGLILTASAIQLYSRALKANWVTSQRAEMQQDFRAAANLLQRDISMAGAGALGQQGLSISAVGLPTAIKPIYPCSQTACNFVNGGSVAFPTACGTPCLYSIIPGPSLGILINGVASDIITLASADTSLALNCYAATINSTGTVLTFQLPATLPSTCVLPTGVAAPQNLNDAIVGLQAGDVVLFGTVAVGVVTGTVTTCAPTVGNTACYTVDFAATDPGHINQPGLPGSSGNLSQFVSTTTPTPASTPITVSAVRVLLVTYYLAIPPATGLPTLMRIQNGKLPAPVAENVVYLKFTYDVYNNGTISTNQTTLPVGTTPGMITKVNIAHMTIRSQLSTYGGYQGLDLQTSVSARNLTSQQEYPISGTSF
jgi:prepilin-type N-terminal cleavage/methylation domain-containing protein